MSTPNDSNSTNQQPQSSVLSMVVITILFNAVVGAGLTILWNLSLVSLGAPTLGWFAGIALWFFFLTAVCVPMFYGIEFARIVYQSTMLPKQVVSEPQLTRRDVSKLVEAYLDASLNLKEDEISILIQEQVQEQVNALLLSRSKEVGNGTTTNSLGASEGNLS